MTFELPALPYAMDALAPHISKETLEYHYGKHHRAYVNNLNNLVPGTEFENKSLEDIMKKATGGIFNNASQIWNHTFYWHSMAPRAGGEPTGKIADAIKKDFGSFADFKTAFTKAATTVFGSGWAWVVQKHDGKLEIVQTGNAGNPMLEGKKPLLVCDVWEHAYYIDTRNDRAAYINNFWKLVHWEFAAKNFV